MASETVKIVIEEEGLHLSFSSASEAASWVQAQTKSWSWLSQLNNFFPHIWGVYGQLIKTANAHIRRWQETGNSEEFQENFSAHILTHLKERKLLLTGTDKGDFVVGLLNDKGQLRAAGAFSVFVNTVTQLQMGNSSDPILGMLDAFLFESEIDLTASEHRKALNSLKAKYSGNISHQQSELQKLNEANEELVGRFEGTLKERSEALISLHQSHSEQFEKIIDDHQQKLTELEQIYDTKLATKKPVEYWKNKAAAHGWAVLWLSISTTIVGALLISALAYLIYWVFRDLTQGDDPKHWQLGILVLGAFFSVWVLRIFVRLLLSNIHLRTDAKERQTMVMTYLALTREGTEFAPPDRQLILQHLFKSSSDGLVKDDAAPPTIFEILTRK